MDKGNVAPIGWSPTKIKNKKCQPAASDTHIPDLIQTECVADSRLARQKKSTERKKRKNKKNEKKSLRIPVKLINTLVLLQLILSRTKVSQFNTRMSLE